MCKIFYTIVTYDLCLGVCVWRIFSNRKSSQWISDAMLTIEKWDSKRRQAIANPKRASGRVHGHELPGESCRFPMGGFAAQPDITSAEAFFGVPGGQDVASQLVM